MPRRPREHLAASVTLAIEGVPTEALLESLEPLAELLAKRAAAPSVTVDPQRITFDLDVVTASSDPTDPAALQDLSTAITDITAALDQVLGTEHGARVVAFAFATQQAREEQLAAQEALTDLLNVTEIAESRGLHRQSAHRTSQLPAFPQPVTTPAGRELGYRRADVEQYFHLVDHGIRARPTVSAKGSSTSATKPNPEYRLRLAQALSRAAAAGQQLPALAAAAADRPPLLLEGDRLLSALDALGGPAAVARELKVTRRTIERWAAWARQATEKEPAAGDSRTTATSSS